MNRTKSVIIRKKDSTGDPCKVYAFVYNADGHDALYIQTRHLLKHKHRRMKTIKKFKGLYLVQSDICLRIETLNELLKKISEL